MENEKNSIKKTTFWNYVVYFTFYSVIGWCYEVFLEVVVYRWGFSNRGVLFGPYTPVYGVGALAFLLLVYPVIRNKKGGMGLPNFWVRRSVSFLASGMPRLAMPSTIILSADGCIFAIFAAISSSANSIVCAVKSSLTFLQLSFI